MGLATAFVIRLPTLLAERASAYDDGAYGASVVAMRHGEVPFREVFSSQGPLFLPLLWLADLIGLRWTGAPRLLTVGAGLVCVVFAARLSRRIAEPAGVLVTVVLVATSGALLLATGRLESDGVVTAFGAGAVLAAVSAGPLSVGLLVGAALSVKSLLALPPMLAAGWLLWRRLGWRPAAFAAVAAAAVVLLTALPWGLAAVWRQSVGLHLTAGRAVDPAGNVRLAADHLRNWDPLLLVAGGAALIFAIGSRRDRTHAGDDADVTPDRTLVEALVLWLVCAIAVLLALSPLFPHHLAIVVPPAAVLVGRYLPARRLTLAALLLLVPMQLRAVRFELDEPRPAPQETLVMADLDALVPAGSGIVTDWPGLAWWSGHWVPGDLVDPSFVRIEAGLLTAASVERAIQQPGVCAVVFWSARFDSLPGLPFQLPGYVEARRYSPSHRLWLREECSAR